MTITQQQQRELGAATARNKTVIISKSDIKDVDVLLDSFKKQVSDGRFGLIYQATQMMDLEAIEMVTQAATDRWTFKTGDETDECVLFHLEGILKARRVAREHIQESSHDSNVF